MNGHKLSELLTDIDEDLVTDACPPEWQAGIIKPPKKKRHPFRALGRVLDSGWTAAVLSILVAGGILVALIVAGRYAAGLPDGNASSKPGNAPVEGPGHMADAPPAGNPSSPGLDAAENGDKAEGLLPGLGIEWDSALPETAEADTFPNEVFFPYENAPLTVAFRYFYSIDHRVAVTEGYPLTTSTYPTDPTFEGPPVESTGVGVSERIKELRDRLDHDPIYLPYTCQYVELLPRDEQVLITRVQIFTYDGEQLSDSDTWDMKVLYAAAPEYTFFVVITAAEHSEEDGIATDRITEYPLYIKLEDTDMPPAEETFAPLPIEGYPTTTVILRDEAVFAAMYGNLNLDPEASDDMAKFADRYCPPADAFEAASLIKLIRSVPVPKYKDEAPSYASYWVGDRGMTFQLTPDGGYRYQFEMIYDPNEATQLLNETLTPLDEPIVISNTLRVLAVTNIHADDSWLLWMDVGGAFAKVTVWADKGGLSEQTPAQVFDAVMVETWGRETVTPPTDPSEETAEVLETLPPTVSPSFSYAPTEDGEGYRLLVVSGYTYNPGVSPVNQIDIPDAAGGKPVVAIADGAFTDVDVAYVSIPATVTEIGCAFVNCSELEGIFFGGTMAEWEAAVSTEALAADKWMRNCPCLLFVECSDGSIRLNA